MSEPGPVPYWERAQEARREADAAAERAFRLGRSGDRAAPILSAEALRLELRAASYEIADRMDRLSLLLLR